MRETSLLAMNIHATIITPKGVSDNTLIMDFNKTISNYLFLSSNKDLYIITSGLSAHLENQDSWVHTRLKPKNFQDVKVPDSDPQLEAQSKKKFKVV